MHLTVSGGSFLAPLLYASVVALLLAPGYVAARVVVQRARLAEVASLPIAYAISAAAGYLAFWCYLLHPVLGKACSLIWAIVAIAAFVRLARSRPSRAELRMIGLTFTVGLAYLAMLYVPTTAIGAAQRFFVLRPPDNVIPQIFAERLYAGADPRHLIGDWLSSDRPPLQTGLELLARPFFTIVARHVDLGYEVCGVAAQLLWLPALDLLCVRAGFTGRRRAVILALAIASGFCLYNTVYTWPKLLAAGFSLAAFVFAIPRPHENRHVSLLLAGICAAFALLAHGGSVFFLAPALLVLLLARRLPLGPDIAWGAIAALVVLLPWAAYQRYYNPPGDRLLKMHLAGINDVDGRPALRAIVQTYAATPIDTIVANKVANVETALSLASLMGSAVTAEPMNVVNGWRLREREHVLAALGAANIGWLALAWWPFRRDADRGALRWALALVGLAVVSTLFWCIALWGPGAAVTTHGAYALELVLFALLGAALAEMPRVAALAIALALADLIVTWVVGSLPDAWTVTPSIDPIMVLVLLVAAAVSARLVREIARPDATRAS